MTTNTMVNDAVAIRNCRADVVAIIAPVLLPSLRWRRHPRRTGVFAIVLLVTSPPLQWRHLLRCAGVFAVLPLSSPTSSRWRHHRVVLASSPSL